MTPALTYVLPRGSYGLVKDFPKFPHNGMLSNQNTTCGNMYRSLAWHGLSLAPGFEYAGRCYGLASPTSPNSCKC